ncbi:mannitol dehydrogenase family protein [Aestuariimicrobium kwangyangense]|uniref:mannitol dehydrogenase family protein n=1 Tax=Aestuariimicrobium kwangyangense TaxID=396389 RepID=UPI0003B76E7B|nr:mannitol dehydrogenase family protein [Aestuariimicrobium kwangyangense]
MSSPAHPHRPTSHPASAPFAPGYDRSLVSPGIVHFGVGNFHRAHEAMYLDRLMSEGLALDWGICGVGVMPSDARMRDVLSAQEGLYTLVLKHPDGTLEPRVIGSIHDYLFAPDDPAAVLDVLTAPTTRIVSLTVTEGGYNIDDETGTFRTEAEGAVHDSRQPQSPTTTFGFIVEALRRRRESGIPPFTVMSCDNLPGNGHIARTAVVGQAGMSDPELAAWIEAEVAFPNCMVDRITPVTTPADVTLVADTWGIEDRWPVTCEPFTQWVLEDDFTLGRPPLERVGVQLVDDVVPYELMKLRLLNASHQSLAHWGRLLHVDRADAAASDPDIAAVTRAYVQREALPTLRPVPGIDLPQYIDTLFQRFSNSAIADTTARLAQDASDRMPNLVLATVRDNLAGGRPVTLGAAMVAAWALGDEGVAEDGSTIAVDDKRGAELTAAAQLQRAGDELAFIRDGVVFGSLADDPVFAEAFVGALHAIRGRGARAVMRELVAGE